MIQHGLAEVDLVELLGTRSNVGEILKGSVPSTSAR
jgi:antitoxin component HigA of HigAB toxin-antitoxin module